MPNLDSGREKIRKYISENDINITDLATGYGLQRTDLSNYLNGKIDNLKSRQIVLRIISDLKIR
ncbi:MAG: helix-turn-helix transcriptional regulator [Streptococcaceae bacterium]|nr:helix-turn-helix transcriptional regulator [Streptococcaceae bacterium]MCH4177270.1 helix-turn-helix transcriptional regulator [Streptococcaceae bacterium]